MFIWITEKFEKHSRTFAISFAVLTGASLVGFFTFTGGGSTHQDPDLPTILGKPLNQGAFDQAKNLVQAQYIVLQGREIRQTSANRDRLKQEAVLQILLDTKARDLGLRVTDEELVHQIQSLPLLRNKSGSFDPEIYHRLVIYLNNRGINEETFEDVVRSQLLHAKLQALVTSSTKVPPDALWQEYEPLHEKIAIDLVSFDMDHYTEPVVVSNEEVQAFYEQNKETFRIPAKVKVCYATFPVADEKKNIKPTDEEIADYYDRNKMDYLDTNNVPKPLDAVKEAVQQRVLELHAIRAASDHATELTVKLVGQDDKVKPDFGKLAAGMGATVTTTEFFSVSEKIPGIEGAPDFAQKAFSLSPDQSFSDPISGSNTFYVLDYLTSQASAIPPYEDVKAKATEQVRRLRTYDATLKMAKSTVQMLNRLLANGKTFAQACADLKLKITAPPPFTVSDDKLDLPSAASIQQAALSMAAGATSELLPTKTGGLIFHLRARQPADPQDFNNNREQFAQQLLQRDRQGMFNDWIQALVHAEQVDFKIHPRQSTDDADASDAGG